MTIHVSLLNTVAGRQIGCLALSAPERINAQNLAMVRQMAAALAAWEQDERVVAVVLLGAGERGFCAGGDLKSLHQAMSEPAQIAQGDAFFAEEYRLCQTIREWRKPILAWGHGIVMGGGWGLFAAASHRVLTESSRLAMPETGIGLFPDVAASWWLPQLQGVGRFLALSGAVLNAADALHLGVADWVCHDTERHSILLAMANLPWFAEADRDVLLLSDFLDQQLPPDLPQANLIPYQAQISRLCEGSFADAIDGLLALASTEQSSYLQHAAQRLTAASPTSLYLSWALQQRCETLSLAQTVELETRMAACALRYGDFKEGIYCTLFNRQQQPRWRQSSYANLDVAAIEAHFVPLSEQLG
ncbi:enoyl-CoA hydratase/isomerase family protein [Chitinibacter sp. GC72]|uniref:enoyl-CoA hydratase/isomerase family protein n=1 Tax=Chitinibacter sp. GC72 TaxID=1526917 RepID=UPI0012F736BA|nr:enoyl-CoA hydratase/isomerase family protein [Chitinibacter sp. GC72]